MIKKEIGHNAGRVWEYLNVRKEEITISELKKKLKMSDSDLNLALGWLAREDKIFFTHTQHSSLAVKLWD